MPLARRSEVILDLIVDLEMDVACLLDCPESVVEADLKFLQIKLARLNREYLLSLTMPKDCGKDAV